MDRSGQTTTVISFMTFVLPESAELGGAKSVSLRLVPLSDDGTLTRNKTSSRRPAASVKRPTAAT
jgi:hypothetical protein